MNALPGRIEKLETKIAEHSTAMSDPAFFRQDSAAIVAANKTMEDLRSELQQAYARWEELEG